MSDAMDLVIARQLIANLMSRIFELEEMVEIEKASRREIDLDDGFDFPCTARDLDEDGYCLVCGEWWPHCECTQNR